jgi:gamma-glutamyltranspeptidase/glutathione hydrolase
VAIIDWNLDPQAAAALPNFGSRNGPTELEADTEVAGLAPKLRAIGADVAVVQLTSGCTRSCGRATAGWAARTRGAKAWCAG